MFNINDTFFCFEKNSSNSIEDNVTEEIDILNCKHLKKDFSILKLNNLNKFNAAGSNIKNFIPRANNNFSYIYSSALNRG